MIEFGNYLASQMDIDGLILNPNYVKTRVLFVSDKELLEIWKEQQPKIVYYK